MAQCITCGKTLTSDEIGLHKKLVNRGATEYMCITCLGKRFRCSEERLREKIEDDPAEPQFILTRRGVGYVFGA